MNVKLSALSIRGYKTIRTLKDFSPRSINILIGANGAGKSNLISFFRLLSWMLGGSGKLQEYVGIQGGANKLLHDGAEFTTMIEGELTLETEAGKNDYSFRLSHAADDTLIFAEEKYRYSDKRRPTRADWRQLDAGHREARLIRHSKDDKTAETILNLMRKCVVYQFHNTSPTARMRAKWSCNEARWLKEDAANIAPFLLRLRENEPDYYYRIVEIVRTSIPFFSDFVLEPEYDSVLLRWEERGKDVVFSAAQASDGMLRFIAVVTLLAQPENDLPGVLIIDEPELGLHPHAIATIASMIKGVSRFTQVFVATQSPTFVNNFDAEDIVVVEREGRESSFTRLDCDALTEWIEEYSLSELWEKNVIGGLPSI